MPTRLFVCASAHPPIGHFCSKTYEYKKLATSNPLQLARLPIPELQETLHRFTRSIQPFASSQQLEEIQAISEKFLDEDGQDLANKVLKCVH